MKDLRLTCRLDLCDSGEDCADARQAGNAPVTPGTPGFYDQGAVAEKPPTAGRQVQEKSVLLPSDVRLLPRLGVVLAGDHHLLVGVDHQLAGRPVQREGREMPGP